MAFGGFLHWLEKKRDQELTEDQPPAITQQDLDDAEVNQAAQDAGPVT